MAAADYKLCDRCGWKAYYDSHVDYDDAAVTALCGECAKTHEFVLREKPPAEPPAEPPA